MPASVLFAYFWRDDLLPSAQQAGRDSGIDMLYTLRLITTPKGLRCLIPDHFRRQRIAAVIESRIDMNHRKHQNKCVDTLLLPLFVDYVVIFFSYLNEFRVEACPLFKQHQCQQHRPYTCFNWHFANQRRRRFDSQWRIKNSMRYVDFFLQNWKIKVALSCKKPVRWMIS